MSTATAPNGATASISRAIVSIETVRIGPKQMTKAVYNQLPEVDFRELGEVWGFVAEHLKHCIQDILFTDPGRCHAHVIGTCRGREGKATLAAPCTPIAALPTS